MSAPLISVIIVCRNPGPALREALESVWGQAGVESEVVVIDAASTDGTPAWLEENRPRLAALVSEPDRGVYDAMNKGIALARGEWLLFLGADDRLVGSDTFARIGVVLRKTGAGVVVGEAAYDDGRLYRLGNPAGAIRRNFVHHQAAFYRRGLFAENGDFQVGLRVMADYEFNLRLWRHGIRFKPWALRVAACRSGGLSDAGRWAGYREEIFVRHLYFPAWRCWLWDAASVVRYLRKKIVRSQASTRPE